jgi:NADP-dependent 3-hydroxy acid dehydrogenase YdfG
MASLEGKAVIITGASSGFGAAAARLFSKEGCKVVLAARRLERLKELADEIRAAGGEALPVSTDVTKHDQIQAMVQSTLDEYGRIDVLFNNAGFGRLDWFETFDPHKDIQTQINVDLLGVIWTARQVVHVSASVGQQVYSVFDLVKAAEMSCSNWSVVFAVFLT